MSLRVQNPWILIIFTLNDNIYSSLVLTCLHTHTYIVARSEDIHTFIPLMAATGKVKFVVG